MKLSPETLGKHFIVGLEGPTLSLEEKSQLKILKPSGIILFARNFATTPDWKLKLKDLILEARIVSEHSIKLISIDFEGGRVNRFPADIKRFPYAQEWVDSAFFTAREMGQILKELEINLTFGPVADLDLNRDNPVIGKRSFSSDKIVAANAALEFMRANQELGIYTCAKHFPGHGRTSLDSHFELPNVSCSKEELDLDLYPFLKLIEAHIPFIMTAHVNFPCLDLNFPASLSKIIQTDLLRSNFGFKGLIISDDMDMKALNNYSPMEKAKIALLAGTDLLLFGNGMDGKAVDTVFSLVENKLTNEASSEFLDIIKKSANRIDQIKQSIS